MAADFTQSARMGVLTTPLGEDALLLSSFAMEEELGRPFTVEIEAASERENIDYSPAGIVKLTAWIAR